MLVAVVLGGDKLHEEICAQRLQAVDLCIAADSGADLCLELGRSPDILLGDLDSISEGARLFLQQGTCEIITYDCAKEATDGALALELAVARGATAIEVFAACGDRLDHMLANIYCAAAVAEQGIAVTLVADNYQAQFCYGSLTCQGKVGNTVALIPLFTAVTGVVTQGLVYPLHAETLQVKSSRGCSNVVQEQSFSVAHSGGCLLVVSYYRQ